MKTSLTILLLVTYLVFFFKPIYPFIEYAVNKDYITKVLCINKDKPKLQCNGKCHLKKQLKKAAQEKENSVPIKINFNDYCVTFSQEHHINLQIYPLVIKKTFYYCRSYFSEFHFKLFHPPKN